MNDPHSAPGHELCSVTDSLREQPAFAIFDAELLSEFVHNCEIVDFEQHDVVWRKSDGVDLDFMILIDGCLAAWGDTWDEDSVDALVTKGQILGEAEIFGFDTTFHELVTLTKSRILVAPKKYIETLFASQNGVHLYHSLAVSLMEKLRAQSNLLKVRTGQNDRRLVKFLDNFTKDQRWRYLTDINLTDIKSRYRKDQFKINLFFNPDLIAGLLCSVKRQIAPAVKNLIKWEVINFYEVDEDFNVSPEPVPHTRFPKSSFPDFPYFQLELIDHTQLMRVLDGSK